MKRIILLTTLVIICFQINAINFYKGSYNEALIKAEKDSIAELRIK